MLLISENQNTQLLKQAILMIICMSNHIFYIVINDFSSVFRSILRCCLNDLIHFIFYSIKKHSSTILPFNIFNCVTHQFNQVIVIRILSLGICNISNKWCIILNMSCNIYGSSDISIVILLADISPK